MFLGGLLLGATSLGLGALAARGGGRGYRPARIALGALLSVLGLVFGALGLLFVLLWAFTDHEVAYHNENILQCAPWVIALVFLGVGVARGNARRIAAARRVLLAAAVASVLGFLLKALPSFDQQNREIIALLLPIWLGSAIGVTLVWQGVRSVRGGRELAGQPERGSARGA